MKATAHTTDTATAAPAGRAFGPAQAVRLGAINDAYEREADRVADRIVSGQPLNMLAAGSGQIQRQPVDEEERIQPKADLLQRQVEEEEEEEEVIQPKTASATPVAAGTAGAAASVSTGGQPMSPPERSYFEPRFGRDLSHVRLHTDAGAAHAARGIGARAFTLRNHIAFAPGQYQPASQEGRRLMAHELTHTLQQGHGGKIRRYPFVDQDEEELGHHRNPFTRAPMDDPRDNPGSTFTYAQSRALTECITALGDTEVGRAECANTLLGTPLPRVRSVAGVSSPVPFHSSEQPAGGVTSRIGPVRLTILPDTQSTDPNMQDRAETQIRFPPLAAGTNLLNWVSQNGRVTSFTFNQDLNALTIQTTFGPGVTATSRSGYGRGTTPTDQSYGRTSLGFHEGEHGRDFITYMQDNPYPRFTGSAGQTTAVFSARVTSFSNAVQAYIQRMQRVSTLRTDCAGTTIDTFNATNGSATTQCVAQPGDPTP